MFVEVLRMFAGHVLNMIVLIVIGVLLALWRFRNRE